MADTPYSIYSEHDEAANRIREEGERVKKEITDLSKLLEETPKGSPEFKSAVRRLKEIDGSPLPSTVYTYVDEDGNDMYTRLVPQGNYQINVKEIIHQASLKREVKQKASNLETALYFAGKDLDEAYALPWAMGRDYVERSRDYADDCCREARRDIIAYGKSIWTRFQDAGRGRCKELVEMYIEAMKAYMTSADIAEIMGGDRKSSKK